MKKKHLKSLGQIRKLLDTHELLADEVKNALDLLSNTLETLPDEEKKDDGPLPVPKEISDEPETIALYSDGGCRGNPGPGSFAYVIQKHDGEVLGEGVDFESLTTNNRMELLGPIEGLRALKDILPRNGKDPLLTKIKVLTDSKYVVDGMKSWVAGWKARGWRKADNKAPENLEYWQELDTLKDGFMQIEWVWVKGHAGHPQNEYCDRKANEIMDENLA